MKPLRQYFEILFFHLRDIIRIDFIESIPGIFFNCNVPAIGTDDQHFHVGISNLFLKHISKCIVEKVTKLADGMTIDDS